MHTDAEVKSTIENAFSPLRCVAKIFDYGEKIRFRVFRPDGEIAFTQPSLVLNDMRQDDLLAEIVRQVRERIASTGVRLAPWHTPGLDR